MIRCQKIVCVQWNIGQTLDLNFIPHCRYFIHNRTWAAALEVKQHSVSTNGSWLVVSVKIWILTINHFVESAQDNSYKIHFFSGCICILPVAHSSKNKSVEILSDRQKGSYETLSHWWWEVHGPLSVEIKHMYINIYTQYRSLYFSHLHFFTFFT